MDRVVEVSRQLCRLSADPESQPYIVRRGILPGLVGFLKNEEPEVVENSAEALKLLSSHRDNHSRMCKEPMLLPSVWDAFTCSLDTRVKQLAGETLAQLFDTMMEYYSGEFPDPEALQMLIDYIKSLHHIDLSKKIALFEIRRKALQDSPLRKEAHYVMLELQEISKQSVRKSVEQALLAVKGVVSIHFNNEDGIVKVLCRCSTDRITRTLEQTGITVLGTAGEQTSQIIPSTPTGGSTARDAKARVAYLRQCEVKHEVDAEEISKKSVTLTGDAFLDARFLRRRNKEQQQKQKSSGGFFSRLKFW